MSKNRMIDTKFWDDNYIIHLDPIEKLLFLYFLTNPLTTICGIYEIALRRISFDTGIDKEMVLKILDRFEKANKIKYENGWIAIKNFIKNQKQSENKEDRLNIGINKALEKSPENLKKWIYNNINLNINLNTNINEPLEGPCKGIEKKQHLEVVFLYEDEYNKLIFEYDKDIIDNKISDLNNYLLSIGKPKKYKSHYHTIIAWLKKDNIKKNQNKPLTNDDLPEHLRTTGVVE